jgi:hypothetical protein
MHMALSKDRNTARIDGIQYGRPVAAGKIIFVGALCCLNANGFLTPGAADNTMMADGVAIQAADNSLGLDGDQTVIIDKRPHRFGNSLAADLIAAAQIGDNCYVVDDETVAKTNGGGTRPVAGIITAVDDDGVWVKFQ